MISYIGSRIDRICRARSIELAARPVVERLERRALLSAGQLDPTFGSGGIVATDFGVTRNACGILAAAVQTDGKTVVTGYAVLDSPDPSALPTTDFPIVRYTSTGGLDPTFGQGGVVYVAGSQDGWAIALQPDGKILVAAATTVGTTTYDALFRYTSAGLPDSTFGIGGRVLTNFGATTWIDERPTSIAVSPDGRILLAGQSDVNHVGRTVLASYLSDGRPDPSFGAGGKVIISAGQAGGGAASMALQPDGKIDIVGTSGSDWYVARLTSGGSLDPSFGTGGTVVTDFAGRDDHANSVAYQPGGDIVVAGSATLGSAEYSALAFYTPTGALDFVRGSGGKVTTSFGVPGYQQASDSASSVALQSDGKIVVGAEVWRSSNVSAVSNFDGWGVARYNRDGSLDSTFGTGGKTVTTNRVNGYYGDTPLRGIAIGPDGKIVLAGYMSGRVGGTFLLQRYQADALASMTGSVFNDLNSNGFRDPGEGGLAGRTVYLDSPFGGHYTPGNPSATTDAAGNFTFSNLAPNQDYVIRQVLPYAWAQTTPANSAAIQVHLTPGQRAVLPAFGAVGGQLIVLDNSSITTLEGDEVHLDQLPTAGAVGDATYTLIDKSLVVHVHHQLPGAINWGSGTQGLLAFTPTVDVQYSFMAYGTVSPTPGSPARAGVFASSSLGAEFQDSNTSTDGSEIHFDHTGILHTGTTYTLAFQEITQGMPSGSTDAVDADFALYLSRVCSTPFMGHAVNIATETVQAENFDDGGEGVAYHDTTAQNLGAAYRNTGVDINAVANASGGYVVGHTAPGEWLNYCINVPAAGSYSLQARVASYKPGGTFHVEVDGVNVTGTMTVPDTGAWNTWQTITSQSFSLTGGTHSMRLVEDRGGYWGTIGNFDSFNIIAAAGPYLGHPFNIATDTIAAVNFDNGGEGIAYHDSDTRNSLGAYRNTGVDVGAVAGTSNGFAVGYTYPGEWLAYTIQAPTTAAYVLQARVANYRPGGTFHVTIDGLGDPGSMTVPDTGPWDTWQTITSQPFWVNAGTHVMKVVMDRPGYWGNIGDFDSFRFLPSRPPGPSPFLGHPFNINTDTIEAENFDDGGEYHGYHDTTPQNIPGKYRATGVDVFAASNASNGFGVGYTAPGEWLSYTINAPAQGTYALQSRVANFKQGGTFHVAIDGIDVTGALTVPNTGPWDTWQTLTSRPFTVAAGTHQMQVFMDRGGYWGNIADFDFFRFAPAGAVTIVSQQRSVGINGGDATQRVQTAPGDFGPFDRTLDGSDPNFPGEQVARAYQSSALSVSATGAQFTASGGAIDSKLASGVAGDSSFQVGFLVTSPVAYAVTFDQAHDTFHPRVVAHLDGPSGFVMDPIENQSPGFSSSGTLQPGSYSLSVGVLGGQTFDLHMQLGSSARTRRR